MEVTITPSEESAVVALVQLGARAAILSVLVAPGQVELRYRRSNTRFAAWWSLPSSKGKTLLREITELTPSTGYEIGVRLRGPAAGASWGAWDRALKFETLSDDQQERIEHDLRFRAFQDGTLSPYPEDAELKDTLSAKAGRVTEALVSASGLLGVGGTYVRLARTAWRVRKHGLAALIFSEDAVKVVAAVAAAVSAAAVGLGLSKKDVTIGAYYLLWVTKIQRLERPEIERSEHSAANVGVLAPAGATETDEAIRRLVDFVPFANIPYRHTAAQAQWIGRAFGMELVASRPFSAEKRPGFALMADTGARRVVLAIRGTQDVGDLLTSTGAITDVATDAVITGHFGELFDMEEEETGAGGKGEEEVVHAHAGMLEAAQWLYGAPRAPSAGVGEAYAEDAGAGLGAELVRFARPVELSS